VRLPQVRCQEHPGLDPAEPDFAVALTGISGTRLAWALADGLVANATDRPCHPASFRSGWMT